MALSTTAIALNTEFLIHVSDRIFYPNETIPINITLKNNDLSAELRDANLTVNISKRGFSYNLDDIKASDSIIKNITLPEFPPGDYVIHAKLKYLGFFDEIATQETFNSFHVRFPEIERLPRNVVIKSFEIPSDITEGETYTVSMEVANEGEVEGNLIIKISGLGESASESVILSPGKTEKSSSSRAIKNLFAIFVSLATCSTEYPLLSRVLRNFSPIVSIPTLPAQRENYS